MRIGDPKRKEQLIVKLLKVEGENLKCIPSRRSSQQPRASTPSQGAGSKAAEEEGMVVDSPATQATPEIPTASATACPSATGGSAMHQTTRALSRAGG